MTTPRILIVAGSDSGGGAGIQADLKTATMLGAHAMTAITAITAQNTLGVQAVQAIPADMVVAQLRACIDDIGVDAVKVGMIGSAETAHAMADVLEELSPSPSGASGRSSPRDDLNRAGPGSPDAGFGVGESSSRPASPTPTPPLKGRGLHALPLVFDPVMVATSGAVLADAATIAAFARLMRLATVVTPNLPELEALGGEAAVLAHGSALLVKGGHADGDTVTDRLIDRNGEIARWSAQRIDTPHTHGTGCTLATALATNLARGLPLAAATARARQFVRLALRGAPGFGEGHGPMGQQTVRLDLGAGPRLNQVTLPGNADAATRSFYAALGLTLIVVTADEHYARFETPGGTTLSVERGARPAVFLEQEDLDAAVAAAIVAGVTFDAPPEEKSWLWREAWTRDPAGNPVCLYQADENRRYPPWRIDA